MDEEQTLQLPVPVDKIEAPEDEQALVTRVLATIREDQKHHDKAFKRMREDMHLATHGRHDGWPEDRYTVNVVGRHVKQKTAALYAKNPKIVAHKPQRLDFEVWDESPNSLMLAFQTVQAAQTATMQPQINPMTGVPEAAPPPPGFDQAMAVISDFQQGTQRREEAAKLAKTLEVLFAHEMREQKPIDFKMGMKKLVRRTCTTGVGYVKLAFSREFGPNPLNSGRISDIRDRIAHLELLTQDAVDGDIEELSAEAYELKISLDALEQEELIVIREGLVYDYPQSTRVIPDKLATSLVGFVGARHLTVEYLFTIDEVRQQFPDADMDRGYVPYSADWKSEGEATDRNLATTNSKGEAKTAARDGMVKVYEHFDKPSGLVYYVADGHPGLLKPAAPPDVFVEDFWPLFALTFNEVENEAELFPPSDARLMLHQQYDMNRARQGQRDHRSAALPRFVTAKGTIEENDKASITMATPFSVTEVNISPDQRISDIIQQMPIPGVDMNLYATEQLFQDLQLAVGSQQATLGGIAKATATESAIAASSMAASDGSSVDDLDNFLGAVARASGQILLREMSEERVKQIVGPGAYWPGFTLDQVADEVFLEIEAGSTGKPNQAVEIDNWMKMLPMMLQIPGVDPVWTLRETVRRLDDRLDPTEAIAAGLPSIAMMNQGAQANAVSPEGPAQDPAAQGGEGAQNAPAGPSMVQPGTGASFGSNQV